MNYMITDFGAVGDGATLGTVALQMALDAAGAAGGGRVTVPPGIFLTGTFFLRSHVTLEIMTGATLLGSPNIADYPAFTDQVGKDRQPFHLLIADHVEDIIICGGGVIDGSGPSFWEPITTPNKWVRENELRVSPMIEIVGCSDMRLQDIIIRNSPGWTCHLRNCDRVFARGVQIRNYLFGPNTDGFDINGCRDVLISDCIIDTGDDAIVLKTSEDNSRACERVTVTNCVMRTNCVALKLGTESYQDMRQITFSNCVVYGSTRAFGLYCLDGATFEDITVSNIICDTENGMKWNRPIHIDLRRRNADSKMGTIRNVVVSNFVARSDGRFLMTAADGGRISNLTLRDVQISYPRWDNLTGAEGSPSSAQFSNSSPAARAAHGVIVADNIDNLAVSNLNITWPAAPGPDFSAIWGRNLRGGHFDNPLATAHGAAEKYTLTGECSGVMVHE